MQWIKAVLLLLVWDNSTCPATSLTEPHDAGYPWNQHFIITISRGTCRCPHTTSCPCSSVCSSCSESGCISASGTSTFLPVFRGHLALLFPAVFGHAPRSIALSAVWLLCLQRGRSRSLPQYAPGERSRAIEEYPNERTPRGWPVRTERTCTTAAALPRCRLS